MKPVNKNQFGIIIALVFLKKTLIMLRNKRRRSRNAGNAYKDLGETTSIRVQLQGIVMDMDWLLMSIRETEDCGRYEVKLPSVLHNNDVVEGPKPNEILSAPSTIKPDEGVCCKN
jgi:hypothetical protein